MAAVATLLDRYETSSSSSSSSSSEENSSSSSSSSWSSSSSSSSSSSASSSRKKKRSKKKKSRLAKTKSKSLVGHDEVNSMLLLGVELLKEVEAAEADLSSLHPISHYVADRSALLENVFSSVPSGQLQAILPPVLKEVNAVELRQLCLQQLQLMPDSTILSIINGDGDSAKTSSTTHTGLQKKKKAKKSKKSRKKTTQEDESSGKTLMELLELEMRARAIKALLKKEEEGEGSDDDDLELDKMLPDQGHHRPIDPVEHKEPEFKPQPRNYRRRQEEETSPLDRKPSPFLSPQPVVEKEELVVEEEDYGIQEVDIELGSGGSGSSSEDDAHSARL